jgi:hypothetical protein
MVRPKQWLLVLPVVALAGGLGWRFANPALTRAAGRMIDPTTLKLEHRLGYHLFAPSWLPTGTHPTDSTKEGAHRILQVYEDDTQRSTLILAQERRNADRDAYHKDRFVSHADGKADIRGKQGYLFTGNSGERRLFWNEEEMAMIISSTVLSDDDLIRVARSCK